MAGRRAGYNEKALCVAGIIEDEDTRKGVEPVPKEPPSKVALLG